MFSKLKNDRKLALSLITAILAVLLLVASSLALFTDREQTATNGKAGSVDITLNDTAGLSTINLTNKDNINPGDYDPDNWDKDDNPGGTPHDLTFTVTNLGNKSVRVRNTIVLSCKDAQGNVLDARYLILNRSMSPYAELTLKGYVLEDKTVVTTLPPVSTKIIAVQYVIPDETVLSGVGTAPEVETINAVQRPESFKFLYYFELKRTAPNQYQETTIQFDVLTEALQYRNTNSADWNLMSVKTWTTNAMGVIKPVLPNRAENDLTGAATIVS